MFVNLNGNQLTRQGVWRIVKEYSHKAGINKDVNLNTFRHSFAVHLLQNGANVRAVQKLLGNQVLTYMDTYYEIINNDKINLVYKKLPSESLRLLKRGFIYERRKNMKRAILIVLDSVGVGELEDAKSYGDEGSHTLDHVYKSCNGLEIKELEKLGIGNIEGVNAPKKCENAIGAYGRSKEASKGKDTVTGHWEISGVILEKPLNTYPQGFSKEIIDEFIKRANIKGILGNVVASGTQIIEELGEEHVKTGYPIIYTSADSVFQIAAHEDIIPVEKLYEMCQIARDMLVNEMNGQ